VVFPEKGMGTRRERVGLTTINILPPRKKVPSRGTKGPQRSKKKKKVLKGSSKKSKKNPRPRMQKKKTPKEKMARNHKGKKDSTSGKDHAGDSPSPGGRPWTKTANCQRGRGKRKGEGRPTMRNFLRTGYHLGGGENTEISEQGREKKEW